MPLGIRGYPENSNITILGGDNVYISYDSTTNTYTITASGGGSPDSPYVLWDTDSSGLLTNERIVQAGENVVLDISQAGILTISAAATGGGAVTSGSYVTVNSEPGLPNERSLGEGTGITITDNGANSTVDIGIASTVLGAPFITLSNDSILNSERKLTVAGGLFIQDGGPNSTLVISASALQEPQYVVLAGSAVLNNESVLTAGTGIGLIGSTISATGSSFNTISVSGQSDVVADGVNDALTFVAGTGVTITTSAGSDAITFTNSSPNVVQNAFTTFSVAGQSDIVADSDTDTFTLVAGTGITLTTNAGTDTLTITNASPNVDQNIFQSIAVSGGLTTTADSPTDTLTVEGRDGIVLSLNQSTDTLIISASGVTSGTNTFGTIAVSGQSDVVADSTTDTLTLAAGTGVSITTNAGSDTVTITNSAPNTDQNIFQTISVPYAASLVADSATDTLTIIASGIQLLTDSSTDTLTFVNLASAFNRIQVSGQSDVVSDALHDILTLAAGTGVSITTDASTDTITITNSSPNVVQNVFTKIAVSGQSDVDADSSTDTLTFAEGTGITITTNAGSDTITITNSAPNQSQNLFETIAVPGWGSIVADSTTDTLTASGVDGVSIGSIPGSDTLVISASGVQAFKTIQVSGQSDVVADQYEDTLTFVAGTNMTITTSAGGDSITFASSAGGGGNTFSNVAAAGWATIAADTTTDTLTASGVDGIYIGTDSSTDTLVISGSGITPASLGVLSFKTVAVSGQSDVVADSATDTLTLAEGTGITITTNAGSDTITITNSSPNTSQNLFQTIAVPFLTSVVADSPTDTLTLIGSGIDLQTDASTDTITFVNQASAFNVIQVAGQSDVIADALADTLTLIAGSNVTITTSGDSITISSTDTQGNAFTKIAVSGQSDVDADSSTDTLTLAEGTGIQITTNAGSDSITFTNTAPNVDQNVFQTIAVSGWPDIVADNTTDTLTASGTHGIILGTVASNDTLVISGSGLPQNAFTTIAVSGQSDVVADGIADTLTLVAGTGVSLTTNAGSDSVTITNSAPNTDQNIFQNIAVSGQNTVTADSATDTLTLAAGTGISITTNDTTDTVTITNSSPNASQNLFETVAVPGWSSIVADSTTDTLTASGTHGIAIGTDANTDTLVISGSGLNIFKTIAVSGQSDVVADSFQDTVTFVAGTNMTITTDANADSITFTASGGGGNNFGTVSNGTASAVADQSNDTLTVTGVDGIVCSINQTTDTLTISASALGTPTFRSFPTSGYIQKGIYYHQGDWTSTGALNLESGIKVLFTGNMTLSHTLTVHASGSGRGRYGGIDSVVAASNGGGPGGGNGARFRTAGGGGGAGPGGNGGNGGSDNANDVVWGGRAYDPYLFFGGSGGGGGSSDGSPATTGSSGGDGGGGLWVECLGTATLNETVSANGQNGVVGNTNTGAGGGGGGGAISIRARNAIVLGASKKIEAKGGSGGSETGTGEPGGGGGGGYVEIWSPTITLNGSIDVSGGAAGTTGSGTIPAEAGSTGVSVQTASTPIFQLPQGGYISSSSGTAGGFSSQSTLTANATGSVDTIYILNPVGGAFTYTMPTYSGNFGHSILVKMASATGGNTATIGFQFGETADWDVTSIQSSTPRDAWKFTAGQETWILGG